jgi:hypothetical protein
MMRNFAFNDLTIAIHGYACDYTPPSNTPGEPPAPVVFTVSFTSTGSHDDPVFGSAGGTEAMTSTAIYTMGSNAFDYVHPRGPVFTQRVEWRATGLVATDPLTLTVGGATLNLVQYSRFGDRAPECPE